MAYTGTNYTSTQSEPGNYTYYVTNTNPITGCVSPADSVVLVINPLPAAPQVQAVSICYGNPTPTLSATGNNINWYNDSLLTSFIQAGNTYTPSVTNSGTYQYFVTQRMNACISKTSTETLTINTAPAKPMATNMQSCAGITAPDFTAMGNSINWYLNTNTTTPVHNGNSFSTGQFTSGTYTYLLNDSVSGCPRTAFDTVTLTIYSLPAAPVTTGAASCEGASIPTLFAIANGAGTSNKYLKWYNDATLTQLDGTGSTYVPQQTQVGTYSYYVTQFDTITGCSSLADSVLFTINPIPAPPATTSQTACYHSSIPTLTASGTNLNWYNDSLLTNNVFNGASFTTADTALGTYDYFVTQTKLSCTSKPAKSSIAILPIPAPPIATTDTTISCAGASPMLSALGANIKWYSDSLQSNLLQQGSTYTINNVATGTYNYYITQTKNACTSASTPIVLTVNASPTKPKVTTTVICYQSQSANLTAQGQYINWYSSLTSNTPIYQGNLFSTGLNAVGTYTYYLNDSVAGCGRTALDTAYLTINALPASPVVTDTTICYGNIAPTLLSSATNSSWYSDNLLTHLVNQGSSYNTGKTAIGIYNYYVTQLDSLTGCISNPTTAVLTINAGPAAPTSQSVITCTGFTAPPLTAQGSNVNWYSDSLLTNLVYTGNTYNTQKSGAGTYKYYINQRSGTCLSTTSTVSLIINQTMAPPTVINDTICVGASVATLTAQGAGTVMNWYADSTLSNQIYTGTSFSPGKTMSGTYTYYVTQNSNGCVSGGAKATLVINAGSPKPAVANVNYCYGNTLPILKATGTNVKWYTANPLLVPPVFSGNNFGPGLKNVGVYIYYVSDSVTACPASQLDTVVLTVNPKPLVTVDPDTIYSSFGKTVTLNAYNAATYSWSPTYQLSNPASSSTTASPAVTTTYTVTGTSSAGCSNTAVLVVMIEPSGIQEVATGESLSAYPNPANDQFILNYTSTYHGQVALSVINSVGQVVVTQALNKVSDVLQLQVNTNALSFGIYTVKVETSNGILNTRIVVVH